MIENAVWDENVNDIKRETFWWLNGSTFQSSLFVIFSPMIPLQIIIVMAACFYSGIKNYERRLKSFTPLYRVTFKRHRKYLNLKSSLNSAIIVKTTKDEVFKNFFSFHSAFSRRERKNLFNNAIMWAINSDKE